MASIKKHKCYIGGEFIATKDHHPVLNPYTLETIAAMPLTGENLLDKALDSATDSFKTISSMKRYERSEILHRIEQGIGKNADELANLICAEGGKPITFARGEVSRSRVTSKWAAEEAVRFGGELLPLDIHPGARDFTSIVRRFPIGVTLAVSPFNFPLNLVMHKLAPAIAVGCPVIIKPSSETPLTALKLAEICHDAGCPPGSVNVVPCRGSAFERLVKNQAPAMLSFTGSAEVGWKLKSVSGRKRIALELGGNAGVVVHEDADLDFAARRTAFGGFAHAGQVCIAVQRVFVHDKIYKKFLEMLLKECRKIKSGDPADTKTVVGPMITPSEADRIEAWIDAAIADGATVLLKGKRKGSVVSPTVLSDVKKKSRVYCDEIFGPVITVHKYKTWDQAIDGVNDSIYGLQAGIFTNDIKRVNQAYKSIETGALIVNDIPTVRVDNYPYGGTKESGIGREGVRCTMDEMTEERVLVLRF
ncbi:MAG TPA: aldehyde dehydrogenase family protein [bacterium]|jgi:glyceraldehyde-3-phosphate dehydrogenase (NADP+)